MSTSHLTGHRVEYYRVEVLSQEEYLIGELDGVEGGEISESIYSTIRSGGSLALTIVDESAVNWFSDRLRVVYGVRTPDGVFEYPLGIFLPTTPGQQRTSTNKQRKIDLYDKLLLFHQDAIETSWSWGVGTVVTDAIADMLAGENAEIVESPLTLRSDKTWEAGTTKLQVINALLQSINYFSLWVDRSGVFQATPYRLPSERSVSWDFSPGEYSVHLPDLTYEIDLFEIPNKVVLVSEGQEETFTATALNENPADPLSFLGRGRWVTLIETGIEAADEATLVSLAQRRLIEGSVVSEAATISHAWLPLNLNEIVTLTDETLGLSGRFAITERKHTLVPGSLTQATLRRTAR